MCVSGVGVISISLNPHDFHTHISIMPWFLRGDCRGVSEVRVVQTAVESRIIGDGFFCVGEASAVVEFAAPLGP